jgi:arabinan endo-1,5-alpha-L-arabinosidase
MDGVPEPAKEWTGASGMWAPEAVKFGQTYYLYYCASQFGKNQSFIGVATSDSAEGPWTDQGEVYKTTRGSLPNAIDPNIVFDKQGNPWLIYGSFFGGIYANRLDPATGKLLHYGDGTLIACREHRTREGSVEGPYMIYHPGYDMYYLFVSYDSLKFNYNIRVARSKDITGPFLDFNGREMTDTEYEPSAEIGTKLLGGYRFLDGEGWLAPGHNSILKDEEDYYIVHHARRPDYPKRFCLHIRQIYWTNDGWPIASPERYAGEKREPVTAGSIAGTWEFVVHIRDSDQIQSSRKLEMLADGRIADVSENNGWELVSHETGTAMELRLGDSPIGSLCSGTIQGVVTPCWDWERNTGTLMFTGLDRQGTAVWGKMHTADA